MCLGLKYIVILRCENTIFKRYNYLFCDSTILCYRLPYQCSKIHHSLLSLDHGQKSFISSIIHSCSWRMKHFCWTCAITHISLYTFALHKFYSWQNLLLSYNSNKELCYLSTQMSWLSIYGTVKLYYHNISWWIENAISWACGLFRNESEKVNLTNSHSSIC